jgi:hypothetical protein
VACVNIPRISYIGNISLRLQAHLAPSCNYKEGSGCAFFLCHKAQRCRSLLSLHSVQLFSDDVSSLVHHLEIGPVALSQSRLWYWHYAVGIARCMMALVLLLQMKLPVLQKITARPRRTPAQHGFGIYEPPAYSGHLQAILDVVRRGPALGRLAATRVLRLRNICSRHTLTQVLASGAPADEISRLLSTCTLRRGAV